MTVGNVIEFVLQHKDTLYVGWPTEQIGVNVWQFLRSGGCVVSLDGRECIDGLVLYRLDKEQHNVWIQEAYATTPGILGKLLELGCKNEGIPFDGSWNLVATRRKYNSRKLRFPITIKTLRRLYYGRKLYSTNTSTC